MGAYAPVPWFGRREIEATVERVFEPIAWRMARDGLPYRGVLYAGLMVTDDGPMVLEFNARFGDPEAQVLLPLAEGELAAALLGCATGDRRLMEDSVAMSEGAAVAVAVASAGYPDAPATGRPVGGAEPSSTADDGELLRFHAGTRSSEAGGYETTGGRVVTFVGRGPDLNSARDAAYRGVAQVELEGGQWRTDIAARELDVRNGAQLGDEAG
jgi:phosphoribosylamine--glycine ligase